MQRRSCTHALRAAACGMVIVLASCSEDGTATRPKPVQPLVPAVDSEKIEASLQAINQYMQTGDWVKAEAIARTLLTRSPNEPRAHEMLGQLLIEKSRQVEMTGDRATAVELKRQAWVSYRRAVELDARNAGLHHSAALVAMTAGDHEAALAMFARAEELDGSNAQYPLFAAQLLMRERRLDEAEAALQRAVRIAPHEPYVHASLAMIALEHQQFDSALASMAIARSAEPDNIGFRAQEAKIHRRRGEPRTALELLIGLSESERALEAVAFEIAAAYEMLGDPSRASDAWGLCFRGNPMSPRAHLAAIHAGQLALKAGRRDDAAQWASIAQRIEPDAAELHSLLEQLRGSGT